MVSSVTNVVPNSHRKLYSTATRSHKLERKTQTNNLLHFSKEITNKRSNNLKIQKQATHDTHHNKSILLGENSSNYISSKPLKFSEGMIEANPVICNKPILYVSNKSKSSKSFDFCTYVKDLQDKQNGEKQVSEAKVFKKKQVFEDKMNVMYTGSKLDTNEVLLETELSKNNSMSTKFFNFCTSVIELQTELNQDMQDFETRASQAKQDFQDKLNVMNARCHSDFQNYRIDNSEWFVKSKSGTDIANKNPSKPRKQSSNSQEVNYISQPDNPNQKSKTEISKKLRSSKSFDFCS